MHVGVDDGCLIHEVVYGLVGCTSDACGGVMGVW
jgi:hypothetical protein